MKKKNQVPERRNVRRVRKNLTVNRIRQTQQNNEAEARIDETELVTGQPTDMAEPEPRKEAEEQPTPEPRKEAEVQPVPEPQPGRPSALEQLAAVRKQQEARQEIQRQQESVPETEMPEKPVPVPAGNLKRTASRIRPQKGQQPEAPALTFLSLTEVEAKPKTPKAAAQSPGKEQKQQERKQPKQSPGKEQKQPKAARQSQARTPEPTVVETLPEPPIRLAKGVMQRPLGIRIISKQIRAARVATIAAILMAVLMLGVCGYLFLQNRSMRGQIQSVRNTLQQGGFSSGDGSGDAQELTIQQQLSQLLEEANSAYAASVQNEMAEAAAEQAEGDAGADAEGKTSGEHADAGENGKQTDTASDDKPKTRKIYITFDDGPSTRTNDILDILDSYHAKATFFVCGKPAKQYQKLYQRIVEDGHTLGMHSYSHKYSELYESRESFQQDLLKLQNFLYDTTGVWCTYYRFPGGSSNTTARVDMQELKDYLDALHITWFDWNVYGGDDVSADTIVSNVTSNLASHQEAMILMHDAQDKEETVKALPKILDYIGEMENTEILPVTADTVPVQHHK